MEKREAAGVRIPDMSGIAYGERCMILVDQLREFSKEEPDLVSLLMAFDLLEK